VNPEPEVFIRSAIVLVNNMPQGIMYDNPCGDPKSANRSNYNVPLTFWRFENLLDVIINAANGNVDILD
jgi:hypothetical protein